MSLWKWSRNWFYRHYGEDIYGYIEKRFSPIIKNNIGEESGYILDAACGFRNTFIQDIGLHNTVGMDINPEVKNKNKLHKEFIIGDL